MSLDQVYIVKSAHFLPNDPISNDEIEDYLGLVNGNMSKSKRIVLRNNGIQRRFYALTKGGKGTHTNAEMTAISINKLLDNDPEKLKSVQLIACGTSTPDQMMPSHGVMVHGWLKGSEAVEIISPSGNCCAGMHALKYAYLSIKSGDVDLAVSTGSERTSRLLVSGNFEDKTSRSVELEENPHLAFEKDFLRWMLSDGAGAFLLSNKPNNDQISLRIEWIEGVSYAHLVDTCMYMGADKEDGTLKSFMDYEPSEIASNAIFSMKQDVRLLGEYIVAFGFEKLKAIFDSKGLKSDEVDYFLPHLSSEFFRMKIADKLTENGMEIPQSKWFTNLTRVGNVGAASIYMMIEELLNNNQLKKGEKILLLVPESARFSYMYAYLTVV